MSTTHATVHTLDLNTPRRFYRGGERILAFRGLPVPADFDGHRPEDWLASTTRLFAEGGGGATVLHGVTDLLDALTEAPEHWLGADHVARYGVATNLLTKLLDSGERLPVHSHPDRTFAARHLDCDHGKTEAWIILAAEPGATVWLGFREHLSAHQLAELVDAQDDRLLAALNPIEVKAGDAILVPAGQPHAIGEGVLVLELQEPTDFSVMLEHARFGLDEQHAFLGLPRATAYESVDAGPLLQDVIDTTLRTSWLPGSGVRAGAFSAFAPQADEFFRAQVVRPDGVTPAVVQAAFAVIVVTQGRGTIVTGEGADRATTDIAAGDVLLVPHAAGDVSFEGDVTAIRCMPPQP